MKEDQILRFKNSLYDMPSCMGPSRHMRVPISQNYVTKQDVTQFFPSGVNFPGQREMAPGVARGASLKSVNLGEKRCF